jgi:hypothetical protein
MEVQQIVHVGSIRSSFRAILFLAFTSIHFSSLQCAHVAACHKAAATAAPLLMPLLCCCHALLRCIFCVYIKLQGMLLGSVHFRLPGQKQQTHRAAAAPSRPLYSFSKAPYKPIATAVASAPTVQQRTSIRSTTALSSSYNQVTSYSSNSSSSRRRAAGSSRNSGAPRRIVPVMVEGHQCHRVGHAHRRLLVGKAFEATSPNGRFVEGEEQQVVC